MIPVKEYTDANEMLADYAKLQMKLNPPPPRKLVVIPQPKKVEPVEAPKPEPKPDKPVSAFEGQKHFAKYVIRQCAEKHGENPADLFWGGMHGSLVTARREAIVRIAKETSLTLSDIARLMCKDHTSIIHAIRRHNEATGEDVRGLGNPCAAKARKRVGIR